MTPGASGHGDPHYRQFRSFRSFTFSGTGEYVVFALPSQQSNPAFQLQGRLGPRFWPATVVVSLSFGVPGQYGYQVQLIIVD